MIQLTRLTKTYGAKTAVNDISATIQPGKVTGFLGPNGAGKSTTMRMIMGLDRPTHGTAIVNGKRYVEHKSPLTEVGALLDAKAVHTGRTAYNHLLAMAATHGIPKKRVHEVIGLTGLDAVAGKRVGGFSLGMGQRLGIAAAMLGDPATLILDEPVNGLDPEGVLWVRQFARHLAGEGRTVFLSSHLMSEMAQTADHIIVLGRGRILADAPVQDILDGATRNAVRVRSPQLDELVRAIHSSDVTVTGVESQLIEVSGLSAAQIGEAAAQFGIVLHELTPINASLEEAYLALTQDEVEYRTEVSR
ncbi:ATP-binding cassette domain-containing protein [Leifsonia poae]|uniref:ATP-binding cassette domain-containing protein n=1 Tax=Leifsonia poae TaxID=110933 RepID=UPI001CC0DB8F|nr:ATP-binding cassette domain-containing protein [Leifsonia poae]